MSPECWGVGRPKTRPDRALPHDSVSAGRVAGMSGNALTMTSATTPGGVFHRMGTTAFTVYALAPGWPAAKVTVRGRPLPPPVFFGTDPDLDLSTDRPTPSASPRADQRVVRRCAYIRIAAPDSRHHTLSPQSSSTHKQAVHRSKFADPSQNQNTNSKWLLSRLWWARLTNLNLDLSKPLLAFRLTRETFKRAIFKTHLEKSALSSKIDLNVFQRLKRSLH